MDTKTCFKCGVEKPRTDFYRHSRMKDGRLNKCKECTKSDVRNNRKAKIEHYRAYDRKRGNRQPPEYYKDYYHRNKEKIRRNFRAYIERNKDKYKARYTTTNAIRDGRLLREPCEVCGTDKHVHAHHDDYSKPMDVRWLCRKHHAEVHKKY